MKNSLYLLFLVILAISGRCWGRELSVLKGSQESSQLFLAATTVEIHPSQVQVIFSRTGGEYLILVEDGAEISEGVLWALVGKEKLELERAFLKADEASLPERIQNFTLGHENAKAAQRVAVKEIKSELSTLEFALSIGEAKADSSLITVGEEALQELRGNLSRAERQLEILEVGLSYHSEIEKLKLGLQRQQASFDLLVRESEERAKFSGVLRFLEPLNNVNNEPVPRKVTLAIGEAVAVLKNEENFDVLLKPLVLDFNGVSRSKLFLRIDGGRGESAIRANFKKFVSDTKNPEAVQAWAFEVEEEDLEDARERELGNEALASVFLDLKEPALIVSKASLLKELDVEGVRAPSWQKVVSEVLPGYSFVAEGRGGIAVRLSEEESK